MLRPLRQCLTRVVPDDGGGIQAVTPLQQSRLWTLNVGGGGVGNRAGGGRVTTTTVSRSTSGVRSHNEDEPDDESREDDYHEALLGEHVHNCPTWRVTVVRCRR